MLKFYIEALKFVWTWTKKFLLAITVLPCLVRLACVVAPSYPNWIGYKRRIEP